MHRDPDLESNPFHSAAAAKAADEAALATDVNPFGGSDDEEAKRQRPPYSPDGHEVAVPVAKPAAAGGAYALAVLLDDHITADGTADGDAEAWGSILADLDQQEATLTANTRVSCFFRSSTPWAGVEGFLIIACTGGMITLSALYLPAPYSYVAMGITILLALLASRSLWSSNKLTQVVDTYDHNKALLNIRAAKAQFKLAAQSEQTLMQLRQQLEEQRAQLAELARLNTQHKENNAAQSSAIQKLVRQLKKMGLTNARLDSNNKTLGESLLALDTVTGRAAEEVGSLREENEKLRKTSEALAQTQAELRRIQSENEALSEQLTTLSTRLDNLVQRLEDQQALKEFEAISDILDVYEDDLEKMIKAIPKSSAILCQARDFLKQLDKALKSTASSGGGVAGSPRRERASTRHLLIDLRTELHQAAGAARASGRLSTAFEPI